MKLIYIGNHPAAGWSKEQKDEWDAIVSIPFPLVPAEASRVEVRDMAVSLLKTLLAEHGYIPRLMKTIKLCIQGESTLVAELIVLLGGISDMVFPTTERVSQEDPKTGVKTSIFKFVRWR